MKTEKLVKMEHEDFHAVVRNGTAKQVASILEANMKIDVDTLVSIQLDVGMAVATRKSSYAEDKLSLSRAHRSHGGDGPQATLLVVAILAMNQMDEHEVEKHPEHELERLEVVELIADHPMVDVDAQDGLFKRRTALIWAALLGNSEAALLLLQRGADPLLRDDDGFCALDHAVHATSTAHVDLVTRILLPQLFLGTPDGCDRRERPVLAFNLAISIFALARELQNVELDQDKLTSLEAMQEKVQMSALGMFLSLRSEDKLAFVCVQEGQRALSGAVHVGCKRLVASRDVQRYFGQLWVGSSTHSTPPSQSTEISRATWLLTPLVVAANLVLVPIVSLVPPLETYLEALASKPAPERGAVHRLLDSHLLLPVPLFRFCVATAVRLLLCWMLTMTPLEGSPPLLGVFEELFTLAWLAASILQEFSEMRANFHLWMNDALNLLELPSIIMCTFAVTLGLAGPLMEEHLGLTAPRSIGKGLLALSLAPLWLTPLVRFLKLSPTFGPLSVMCYFMLWDVVCVLVIQLIFMQAFGGAMFFIVRAALEDASALPSGCSWDASLVSLAKIEWQLLLVPITAYTSSKDGAPFEAHATTNDLSVGLSDSSLIDCLQGSHYSWVTEGLLVVYTVLSTVLLLNMLIARMAKTFDLIWNEQTSNYLHGFARIVLAMQAQPISSMAPFNLIGMPYHGLHTLSYFARPSQAECLQPPIAVWECLRDTYGRQSRSVAAQDEFASVGATAPNFAGAPVDDGGAWEELTSEDIEWTSDHEWTRGERKRIRITLANFLDNFLTPSPEEHKKRRQRENLLMRLVMQGARKQESLLNIVTKLAKDVDQRSQAHQA